MGVDGFKMMISFAIIVCMMAVYRVHLTWNVVLVIPILALLLIITFAAMTILMHLGVFVEDMSNIVTILFRLLFYVTGIFYSVYKRLPAPYGEWALRSEEHTSELQSRFDLVCRLLLEKKKAPVLNEHIVHDAS